MTDPSGLVYLNHDAMFTTGVGDGDLAYGQRQNFSATWEVISGQYELTGLIGGVQKRAPVPVVDGKACVNLRVRGNVTKLELNYNIGVKVELAYDLKDVSPAERKEYYWSQIKKVGSEWKPDGPERYGAQRLDGTKLALTDQPGTNILLLKWADPEVAERQMKQINGCFETSDLQKSFNEGLQDHLKKGDDVRLYRSLLKKGDGTVVGYFEWGFTIAYSTDHDGNIRTAIKDQALPLWKEGTP